MPIARRILADVDTAKHEVGELVGLRRGRVRVGATPSLCVSVFADVLARYHAQYPESGCWLRRAAPGTCRGRCCVVTWISP